MKSIIDLTKTLYKHVDIEIQYLIYKMNGTWKADQISANGTPNSADLIDEYLIDAIFHIKEHNVKEVYIVHNHPVANPKPSFMDYYNHKTIEAFLRLSNIKTLDYIIVSPYGYYSFKEDGKCNDRYYESSNSTLSPLELSVFTLEEIEGNKELLCKLLNDTNEILITPNGAFAGNPLDVTKLFKSFEEIKGNHFFFCKSKKDEDLTRLKDLYKVFSPIEIFSMEKNILKPLIINGVID